MSLDFQLRNGSHAVKIAAAERLAEAGEGGALVLAGALKETDRETYEAAAWGIEVPMIEQSRSNLGQERLRQVLKPATEYLIAIVRQTEIIKGAAAFDKRAFYAIGALGAIGDSEALPALEELLSKVRLKIESEGVTRERVESREKVGWVSTEDDLRHLEREIERITGTQKGQG